jgi:iron complex transport system substrate-binding protein
MFRNFLRWLGLLLVLLLLGPALAQSQDSFPITLVDDLGRSVTVRRPPERIVSIAPSNTEVLFSLGLGGMIVGVDRFSDFPPEAKQKAQVGGMIDPDFERIASLRPDLVFATGELQRQAVETSARLGLLVFALNPSTVDGVLQSIAKVARITGVSRRGQEVTTSLRQRASEVTRKTRMIPLTQRPSVFWVVWPEPLMAAGPRTFIHDLIVLAGGRNIAADVRGPRDYPIFSLEEVASRNPDVIISTDEARGALGDLKAKEGWKELLAVRRGRVYFLNSALVSRPGPRLVDGLEAVARLLHPSLFSK